MYVDPVTEIIVQPAVTATSYVRFWAKVNLWNLTNLGLVTIAYGLTSQIQGYQPITNCLWILNIGHKVRYVF